MKTKITLAGLLIAMLVGLQLTLVVLQKNQNTKSKASAATILSFSPPSQSTTPVQKKIGEIASFDIMVEPGANQVSTVKLQITYDPTKFSAQQATVFATNLAAFPSILEGPVLDATNGNIYITVSIGADPTKAIKTITKLGTITLTTRNTTTTATSLIFGAKTQVLSVAPGDAASQNVLASSLPAYIAISAPSPTTLPTSIPSPTNVPTTIPTPTKTPTPTPIPTATPTISQPTATPLPTSLPTATNPVQMTKLSFTVFLHGIGASGDNVNQSNTSLSNKNPLHPEKTVTVAIFNALNQLVATKTASIVYNTTNGNFIGTLDLGNAFATGDYVVKVKTPTHLQRRAGGIASILAGQTTVLPEVTLITGDTNNDNLLNIIDYNNLIACYSDLLPAIDCNDTKKMTTDIDDDGNVNQTDYNLFLREITVQNGD